MPELAFENASAEKILLVDGDELIGAKQNRVVNISILVGGGKRVPCHRSFLSPPSSRSYRGDNYSDAGGAPTAPTFFQNGFSAIRFTKYRENQCRNVST